MQKSKKPIGTLIFLLLLIIAADAIAIYSGYMLRTLESSYDTLLYTFITIILCFVILLCALLTMILVAKRYSKAREAEVVEQPAQEKVVEKVVIKEVVKEAAPSQEVKSEEPSEKESETREFERLQRSFIAKLVRSEDSVKENYSELKNSFLSYKKVRARLSFKCETVKLGRNLLAKIQVRGKSLVVFFALDEKDLEGTKYKTQEAPTSKAYQQVPVKFRVNSPRKLQQAKEMVGIVMAKFEAQPNAKYEPVDFKAQLPANSSDAIMEAKGLIKVKK